MLVVRLDHDHGLAALPLGPERLLLPGGVVAHHAVRRVQDPLGAPVVLLELYDGRVRVVALEVEDVPDVGAAPREDRLVVVADDTEVLLGAGEVAEQNVLGAVRVLVLVDEDVVVAVLPLLERAVARLEQAARQDQEIVEIDRVVLLQERVVTAPDRGADPVKLPPRLVGEVGRAAELVLGTGDDRTDRAGREQPFRDAGVAHRLPEEGPLVGGVVDREASVEPDLRAVPAQEPGAEGVERAGCEIGEGGVAQELLQAAAHLLRRLVGERDGEDLPGRHVQIPDEVGDPVRERPCLARPGPGEDEERASGVGHRGTLLRIEDVEDRVGTHHSMVGIAVAG